MGFAISWDQTGQRFYETGTDRGVLYLQKIDGTYEDGVAWNGLSSVSESPEGGEAEDIYADNMKYLSLTSAEDFGGTIEAYTYPEDFEKCDGSAELGTGVKGNQQTRSAFGFTYRSLLGNDTAGNDYGYKIHLIYNAKASPSERQYQTVNDSPEAITFSWEFKTTPVVVKYSGTKIPNPKPLSLITIDSTKISAEKLLVIEQCLYGTNDETKPVKPWLPSPDQIIDYMQDDKVPVRPAG